MATILSVTLTSGAGYGATRHAERAEIRRLLQAIEQKIGDGATTSGTVLDGAGNSAGTYTYTPVAAS
jgi:hypothetical protein